MVEFSEHDRTASRSTVKRRGRRGRRCGESHILASWQACCKSSCWGELQPQAGHFFVLPSPELTRR